MAHREVDGIPLLQSRCQSRRRKWWCWTHQLVQLLVQPRYAYRRQRHFPDFREIISALPPKSVSRVWQRRVWALLRRRVSRVPNLENRVRPRGCRGRGRTDIH